MLEVVKANTGEGITKKQETSTPNNNQLPMTKFTNFFDILGGDFKVENINTSKLFNKEKNEPGDNNADKTNNGVG